MGRDTRVCVGNMVYHVLNRANGREKIFRKDKDYETFENILEEAKEKYPIRILTYTTMPNHWHLQLYPYQDNDLSKFVQWLTLTHTQRWHAHYQAVGYGHLYQGRFKSFVIEKDNHFIAVARYIERNPVRAKLVKKVEDWKWGSVWRRKYGSEKQRKLLAPWPVAVPADYERLLNTTFPNEEKDLEMVRTAVTRGRPFGNNSWVEKITSEYNLGCSINPKGRPRKKGS